MRDQIATTSRDDARIAAPATLLGTQLLFNVGFYAVVPFIAVVLTDDFALGGAAVGLVLGVRAFSQQGMFLVGGVLADRWGAKALILVGCGVRASGFLLLSAALWPQLGTAPEPPLLSVFIAGTVLTGLGGAMFSPALNTLVAGADRRRSGGVNLFAWLTVAGELGAATGPLVGALLLGRGFAVVAVAGAGLFAVIGCLLWWRLPQTPRRSGGPARRPGRVPAALTDRRFVAFAALHSVDLLAYNQLYLAFPVELRRVDAGALALGAIFAWVSVLTVALQLPVASWSRRLPSAAALRIGYLCGASAFLVLAIAAPFAPAPGWELLPAFAAATLLTAGHLFALPTALGAVGGFAGALPTGSYFGLLATCGGLAVLVGNVVVGALLGAASLPQPAAALPWLALAAALLTSAGLVGSRWMWVRR
ncbi:MFS transporter [Microbacterium sp.]|uniref:MFS transporter n=1 Tax=Microbacterium sp. TaxID=51671 RepID=UPI0039E6BFE5